MVERVIDTSTMEVDQRGEVVRCRDCRHCAMVGEERVCQRLPFRFKVNAKGFCSWGERREP